MTIKSVLKAPVGGRYERGTCEPVAANKQQCIDEYRAPSAPAHSNVITVEALLKEMMSVLKAPLGGKYERGACEPVAANKQQCVDQYRAPTISAYSNVITDKALLKKMEDPKWQARQIALLNAESKGPSGVERYFGNMLKIAALPFALLGAGCSEKVPGKRKTDTRESMRRSVVGIYTTAGSRGTGFVVRSPKGKLLVATAAHVIDDGGQLMVLLGEQVSRKPLKLLETAFVRVRPVAADFERDLALLEIRNLPAGRLAPLPVATDACSEAKVMWGYPPTVHDRKGMLDLTDTAIISKSPARLNVLEFFGGQPLPRRGVFDGLAMRPQMHGGNSGGPVLDARGRVVGVLIRMDEKYKQSAVVCAKYLKPLLETADAPSKAPTRQEVSQAVLRVAQQVIPFAQRVKQLPLVLSWVPPDQLRGYQNYFRQSLTMLNFGSAAAKQAATQGLLKLFPGIFDRLAAEAGLCGSGQRMDGACLLRLAATLVAVELGARTLKCRGAVTAVDVTSEPRLVDEERQAYQATAQIVCDGKRTPIQLQLRRSMGKLWLDPGDVNDWLEQASKGQLAGGPPVPAGWVMIQPGEFKMGTPDSHRPRDKDERQHPVRLTRSFMIKATEVTQGEWHRVMGNNPSYFKHCGEECPVERVSWFDAVAYANALSRKEGLQQCYELTGCSGSRGTGCGAKKLQCKGQYKCRVAFKGLGCKGYRLPTEAEWEYAARAGTNAPDYPAKLTIKGLKNAPELDPIAWYGGNSGVTYSGGRDCSKWKEKQYPSSRCGTHPVRKKQPNRWGLYDILGNVFEWCHDWYNKDYPPGPVRDPIGPDRTKSRVMRGGSYFTHGHAVRAAYRSETDPGHRYPNMGFRLVRSYP